MVGHGGRIIEKTGDGFLTELPSPSDAVNAALRFQATMRQAEWPGEMIRARCAIHLGELTQLIDPQTGEIRYGGMAINVAARLMDLGQGGQILLSRAVFDDARRNVRAYPSADFGTPDKGLSWQAHGRYLFKGAEEPTEVFEVAVSGLSPLKAPPNSSKAKRYLDAEEESTLGWRPAQASKRKTANRMKTMRILTDISWLLPLCHGAHEHHEPARNWLDAQPEGRRIVVCRLAEMRLLRLLSNPSVMGSEVCSTSQEWKLNDRLFADSPIFPTARHSKVKESEDSGVDATICSKK